MLFATFYTPGAQSQAVLDKLPYSKYDRIVVERLKWSSGTDPTLRYDSSLTDAKLQAAVDKIHSYNKIAEMEIFTKDNSSDDALNDIFSSDALIDQLAVNIAAKANQFGFDGVNLDPENHTLWQPDATLLANIGKLCIKTRQALGSKLLTFCPPDNTLNYPPGILESCDAFYIMSYRPTLAEIQKRITDWSALIPKRKIFVGTLFGCGSPWKVYREFILPDSPLEDSAISGYKYLGRDSHAALAKWVKNDGFAGIFTYSQHYDTYETPRTSLIDALHEGVGVNADMATYFTFTIDGEIVSDPLAFKVYSDSGLTAELTSPIHLGQLRRGQNYSRDIWVKNISGDQSGPVAPVITGDIINKLMCSIAPASQNMAPGAVQKFTVTYSVKSSATDGAFSGTLSG